MVITSVKIVYEEISLACLNMIQLGELNGPMSRHKTHLGVFDFNSINYKDIGLITGIKFKSHRNPVAEI